MTEEDVVYWRTLAEERGRALDTLHDRLRNALGHLAGEHVAAFADAWNGRHIGWIREPERMEPLSELRECDVASALDELWTRVANDGGR